jgi:diaminohydroxyphosphoribosylaminopyrimidine deaminase/5-amino-6-(5-phosphoribosylamino)uracil reductase
MRRAVVLAQKGRGAVSPNPLVGAVLVRGGRQVGSGCHRIFGGPHAETIALGMAGDAARGATLYTNLEPCAHQGKTPPCALALREAGVLRVVVGASDPDPRVKGRGLNLLRRAGIQVQVGVEATSALAVNEAYFTRVLEGRPHVTLKAGTSLDGRIAGSGGASRWVTSPEARQRGRQLRQRVDAVVVGGGTALTDDPRLSARQAGRVCRRQPLRVVLAGRRSLGPQARMLRDGLGPVVIYGVPESREERRILEEAGAEVVQVALSRGRPDVRKVLVDLAGRGLNSVLVEGGGEVAWSFLRQGQVDRLIWFLSPLLLGGGGVPVVGGPGVASPGQGIRLERVSTRSIGPDLEITARPLVDRR